MKLATPLLLACCALSAAAQSWPEVGGSATAPGIPAGLGYSEAIGSESSVAVAADASGRITVAWLAWTDNPYTQGYTSWVYMMRWDGSSWTELGDSAHGGGLGWVVGQNDDDPRCPFSLALGPAGDPYVAWTGDYYADGNNVPIYVRRWNPGSGAWEGFGGS